MLTIDEIRIAAPVAACFQAAADVERWPEILPHYRWVTFRRRDGFGRGLVEMAARRAFPALDYPVWWVSEMTVDERRPVVIYRHVDGVTTGMDVEWSFRDGGDGTTHVRIVHAWEEGPHWPLPSALRRAIAGRIIGPVFIHHVASRTLLGIKRAVEGGRSPANQDEHVL
jgi:ribosome-associated toxin RatA of RatAB toxin-antitoxin module